MLNRPKNPLVSKTVWLGTLVTVLGAFQTLVSSEWGAENPDWTNVLTAILGLATVFVRFTTKQEVSVSAPLLSNDRA